ncbi:hypothetical protein GCM10009627_17910 [Curtobacterium herbarum]|uniref:Uncharacterized protein n=1 Tax=Curtobacterium herbarum TaxID=150122 RepID=A0ABN1ZCT7_9MICO
MRPEHVLADVRLSSCQRDEQWTAHLGQRLSDPLYGVVIEEKVRSAVPSSDGLQLSRRGPPEGWKLC